MTKFKKKINNFIIFFLLKLIYEKKRLKFKQLFIKKLNKNF